MNPQKPLCSSKVDIVVDRLSEMPDQVLVHILSLMPTRDAVRTMLIRRFGYLWTMVHFISLDFSEHFTSTCYDDDVDDDDAYEEERRIMSAAFSRFARFVRNVLMLHRRSTIDCFHLKMGALKVDHVDPWLIDDIQVWLKFATDREVKHLFFACKPCDEFTLPRFIFTSQSLVTLTLFGSRFKMYEHEPQLHMGALRKLSLVGVDGSNEAFNQLISACPSLQEVEIFSAEGLTDLNIIAPSASRLDLKIADGGDHPFTLNCPHVKILDISVRGWSLTFLLNEVDVSSLQVVNIGRLPKCWSGLITHAFLRHFRDAEVFTLSSEAFEQLCCLKKVDIPKNRWQTLALQPRWDNERCLQVIIELVKSSEDLDELIIYSGESWATEGNDEVRSSELSTSCEMPLLKNVTIHGFGKYREGQLQLVEFILKNAVILEKMVITCEKNQTAVEELEFVKQVSSFKRASANVIVDFDRNIVRHLRSYDSWAFKKNLTLQRAYEMGFCF